MTKILIDEATVKLVLEALENSVDLVEVDYDNAVTLYGKDSPRAQRLIDMQTMRDDHIKAITALQEAQPAQQQSCYCLNCEELSKQVTALKTCLEVERGFHAQEQPAQGEPAFYRHEDGHLMTPDRAKFLGFDSNELQPLYTTPQPAQRTWVGLTYEEAKEIYTCIHGYDSSKRIAEAIEAKLKEKNT